MKVSIVVASSLNDCIGINNTLPWNLPRDLKRFKSITIKEEHNVLIMGRKTFESIGKPLPNRINYVLTKKTKTDKNSGVTFFNSLEDALIDIQWWGDFLSIEYNVFIIGGSGIFSEAIDKKIVDTIYHTIIHENIIGDTFLKLPEWSSSDEETFEPDEKNKYKTTFRTLKRI